MTEQNRLDDLFAAARNEDPKVSYAQAKSNFLQAIGLGFFGVLLLKWAGLSTKLKIVVMLSIVGIGSMVTLVTIQVSAPDEPKVQLPISHVEQTVNKQVTVEPDGSSQTVYFDDDSNVVNVVETQVKSEEFLPLEVLKIDPIASPDPQEEIIPARQVAPQDTTPEKVKTVLFTITKNIKDDEMARIQREAKAAGIDFRYRILVWRGRVKKCTIGMTLATATGSCSVCYELKGKFNKTVGWIVDEEGKAIEIID